MRDDDEGELGYAINSNKKKVNRSSNDVKSEDRVDTSQNQEKFMEEEEMLDVAEHCLIRIAETMLMKSITVR